MTVSYDYMTTAPQTMPASGTLRIDTDVQQAPITGFSDGDTIELASLNYSADLRAGFSTTANGTSLVLTGPSSSNAPQYRALTFINPTFAGADLRLSSNGVNGTRITFARNNLAVSNPGTNSAVAADYVGPVSGLQHQYIAITADNVIAGAATDNWFLKGGDGNDALQAHGGRNVLDGGTGSNFLIGGTGTDTFFVTATPGALTWSTIGNAHAGDDVTLYGLTQDASLKWSDGLGSAGYTGLTLDSTTPSGARVLATLSGYTLAHLTSGHITPVFGPGASGGTPYLHLALS